MDCFQIAPISLDCPAEEVVEKVREHSPLGYSLSFSHARSPMAAGLFAQPVRSKNCSRFSSK